jgi:formamidopyrimidine-DNA glycosylase
MPELAEVEFYRKQWSKGIGKKVLAVHLNAGKKIFQGTDVGLLRRTLEGAKFLSSKTHGKQLLLRFSKDAWVGIHLGMTGHLRIETDGAPPLKHDHLVLRQAGQSLVLSDARQFGRVLFHRGKTAPQWWSDRAIEVLSRDFTVKRVGDFLARHCGAPIKAVLLMQAGFPGIGNWMADEILWQSRIHPARPAKTLSAAEIKTLHAKARYVSRESLRTIGKELDNAPKTWLFGHRWEKGGHCPRNGAPLQREDIGGRTTCWCPICQKLKVRV